MAIGVKGLERPIEQTSYVRATIQGMALTFRHLFREKVTYQYPEEKWSLSPRWRASELSRPWGLPRPSSLEP